MKIYLIVAILLVLVSACGDPDIISPTGRFSHGVAKGRGKFSIIALDQSFHGDNKKLPPNFFDLYAMDDETKSHAEVYLQRNSMFEEYGFSKDEFLDSAQLVFNERRSRQFNEQGFQDFYPDHIAPNEGTELPMFIIVPIESENDQLIRNQGMTLSILTRIKYFENVVPEEQDLLQHPDIQPPFRRETISRHDIGVNPENWQIHHLSRIENILQDDEWEHLGLPEKEPGKEYYYLPLYQPVEKLDMILTTVSGQNLKSIKAGNKNQGIKRNNSGLATKTSALRGRRGTRYVPLDAPWAIVCDHRSARLGNLCRDENKMQDFLRHLRKASNYFKGLGYMSSVYRPLYGHELEGPGFYKENMAGNNQNTLFQTVFFTAQHTCNSQDDAGCYDPGLGVMYLTPRFFSASQNFQKFAIVHEIFHPIQYSEYPHLTNTPHTESFFVIEGVADYLAYEAMGWNANSPGDMHKVNRQMRNWNYPLNPKKGFNGEELLNYNNSQFFRRALPAAAVPSALKRMNEQIVGGKNSYQALGNAINHVTRSRVANLLFSNDPDLAGLAGAYVHSTIENAKQDAYPYCLDARDFTLDSFQTHLGEEAVRLRGASLPMSGYCAGFDAPEYLGPGQGAEFPCVEITLETRGYRPGELNLVIIPDEEGQIIFQKPFGLFNNVQADLSGKALLRADSRGMLLVVDSDPNPARDVTDAKSWEIKMERKVSCDQENIQVRNQIDPLDQSRCNEKRWSCDNAGCGLVVKSINGQCEANLGYCPHDRACEYKANPNECKYMVLCAK